MKKILAVAAAVPALALLWAMARPSKPAVVACVELVRVFESLDQYKAGKNRIMEMMKEELAKSSVIQQEAQALQAELDNYKPDTPGFHETGRKITEKMSSLMVREQFLKAKEANEFEMLVRDTYLAVKASLGGFCKTNGIDIVLVDDASAPFSSEDRRPIFEQISGRRIVWFDPALDVTDDLIKSMNQAYAAGGGQAPAPAAGTQK